MVFCHSSLNGLHKVSASHLSLISYETLLDGHLSLIKILGKGEGKIVFVLKVEVPKYLLLSQM